MKVTQLPAGTYVVAVSGGVDSVVLLNMLSNMQGVHLVVAHFDHGIRSNSAKDCEFVRKLAKQYKLPFEYSEGLLGEDASEADARTARYEFLKRVKAKHKAKGIITAHHQDDVLETIILNILRGTSRKGLSSLQSNSEIIRPLLHVTKTEILDYANTHKLEWREDETNQNTAYMRNWIRHTIIPKLSHSQREQLVGVYEKSKDLNQTIDTSLEDILLRSKDTLLLNSKLFAQLSHVVAKELCAAWLRRNGIADFDSATIERLTIGMKTLAKGKVLVVKKGYEVVRDGDSFRLRHNIR